MNKSSKGSLIYCPKCEAKLRPSKNLQGSFIITCPKCKEQFEWKIEEKIWKKKFQEFKDEVEKKILDIENRDDISVDKKVTKVIMLISATCSALATQPLPGMDIFYLTPIQGYMGIKISQIRGLGFKDNEIKTMIKEVLALVGLGLAGQNFVLTLYKIGFPFMGGLATIPLVYSATYGIGKAMDYYFIKKSKSEIISKVEINSIWKEAKKHGKENYPKAD